MKRQYQKNHKKFLIFMLAFKLMNRVPVEALAEINNSPLEGQDTYGVEDMVTYTPEVTPIVSTPQFQRLSRTELVRLRMFVNRGVVSHQTLNQIMRLNAGAAIAPTATLTVVVNGQEVEVSARLLIDAVVALLRSPGTTNLRVFNATLISGGTIQGEQVGRPVVRGNQQPGVGNVGGAFRDDQGGGGTGAGIVAPPQAPPAPEEEPAPAPP
ncbi:MAG: hypothetical protein FWF50_06690, partial [Defluviitaleaceae bacterium]|nr:hypothetical protein [Defluviitaleaceae bacterium]